MLKVKDYYHRILSHQPLLETDKEEEENSEDAAESDFSTSDEDCVCVTIDIMTEKVNHFSV
uniref:Uncharacterized protein n=1 Tax=Larimichthys crocea TaxID=215358 RepID=A0A0F8ARZ8_LARCR